MSGAFSCWHKYSPEYQRVIYEKTASAARYAYFLHISDPCPDVQYIDIRSRKLTDDAEGMAHQTIDFDRLEAANRALQSFVKDESLKLIVKNQRIAVEWYQSHRKQTISKTWTPLDKHFPEWHERAPWGGTQSTAISQLVRWIVGLPVFGIGVWENWADKTGNYCLCKDTTVQILKDAGYPPLSICVLCKERCKGLDWWDHEISGPCCSYERCQRQKEVLAS